MHVSYYAVLREQAGRDEERLATTAGTPRELRDRSAFQLAAESLRVAVNCELGDWTQPLRDGDAVVFIPPVSAG